MAYTIEILHSTDDTDVVKRTLDLITSEVKPNEDFTIRHVSLKSHEYTVRSRAALAARRPAWAPSDKYNTVSLITFQGIRLANKKGYCGQHPGPCDARAIRRKMKSTLLESADWIKFHARVNRALDAADGRLGCITTVFTTPQEQRGKLWVRWRGSARKRYDYWELERAFGVPIRAFIDGHPGTPEGNYQYVGPASMTDSRLRVFYGPNESDQENYIEACYYSRGTDMEFDDFERWLMSVGPMQDLTGRDRLKPETRNRPKLCRPTHPSSTARPRRSYARPGPSSLAATTGSRGRSPPTIQAPHSRRTFSGGQRPRRRGSPPKLGASARKGHCTTRSTTASSWTRTTSVEAPG